MDFMNLDMLIRDEIDLMNFIMRIRDNEWIK